MEMSLHVAAAGQKNLQEQLRIVAHNIANANTAGFKAEIVDFKSLISRAPDEDVHFPQVAKLYPSVEQGGLIRTDNPLDIALSGDGWFAIATPAGTAYTRDGRMMINGFGELRSIEGYPVLDAGGAPIQINPSAGAPEIQPDGRVISDGRQVGNVGVFQMPPENLTSRFSNSAFLASVPGVPVVPGDNVSINQGFIEGSNVSAVDQLANLITISKSYQSVSTLIGQVDDALSKSVRELGGGQ